MIELNSEIVTQKMVELGLPRITAELDGTVLSTGDTVAWAARGYNPMNRHYQGNSAHQQISLLAYNLVRNFQIDTEQAPEKKSGCKRTHIFEFQSLETIRIEIINAAGRILKTSAGKILQITHNVARDKKFSDIGKALDSLEAA